MMYLSGQNYGAKEIIQNVFSPLIGIITSSNADDICHRNNLSFVELLQPFARLQNDVQFIDALGTSVSIKGLRLNFCDVDWRPPQTVLARKMLNEAVTNVNNVTNQILKFRDVTVEFPSVEPWFEQWRETFLNVQFPGDHEFTRHILSCLIVLSSGDPNIIETAQKLSQRVHQMQSVTPQKLPKWFHSTNVLNSYVILHEENQDDLQRAQHSFELLKSTFGDSKCFLLQLNSLNVQVPNELPDYWVPFIKRQPKSNDYTSNSVANDQLTCPKTPTDFGSISVLSNIQISGLSDNYIETNESTIQHPLSPAQEQATEALNSKFSISTESIASQNINTNIWLGDTDAEARHGQCLNAMDIENIRHFVQDYAVRALIPYVEHLVNILHEAITNKKGVSKSLLSATKRWFVTSKPGLNTSTQNTVIYTQESAELQTRKLGDLYFMFCHYNMAFQAYHQAKRDFNADSAWQYYAGALEMAALSAFMLGTANRKTYDYMEDAIACYLNVCKLQQFATRATLLSVECLKMARLYGEAAKQLLRMTSEESDLRSALLIEQAAYCFLSVIPTAMYRKYAFQMVLAGNRYSRAGQRKHAYRCYSQSFQIFCQRGWSLAEDHIQYTMGKQACILKKLEEASTSFAHLLRPNSLQNHQQQFIFLKEYLLIQNEYAKRNLEFGLVPLAIPQILHDSLRVLTLIPNTASPVNSNSVLATNIDINSPTSDENIWQKIEEMLVTTASSNRPFIFKPLQNLFTKDTPTSDQALAIQGEPIFLTITLINPIGCAIRLKNIDLIWRLKLDNKEVLSNICLYEKMETENSSKAAIKAAIKTICPEEIVLTEKGQQMLNFKLIPKLTGLLSLTGMVAQINSVADSTNTLLGYLKFEAETHTAQEKPSKQMLLYEKLKLTVIPSLPSLSASFSIIPSTLMAGEILPITVTLRNEGRKPIEEIYLGTDSPRWFTLQDKKPYIPHTLLGSINNLSKEKFTKDKEIRRQHVFRLLKPKTADYLDLQPQQSINLTAWLQAPYTRGDTIIRLMIYYALPIDSNIVHLKYRLIRHTWKLKIEHYLTTEACCVIGNHITGELSLTVDIRQNVSNNQQQKVVLQKTPEIYVNSLVLSCDNFMLNSEKFYIINQSGMCNGSFGSNSLKTSKYITLQCGLKTKLKSQLKEFEEKDVLKEKLSYVDIKVDAKNFINEQHTLKPHELYGFLVKHYTIYFNSNISIEEFNKILINYEPITILTINWSAKIQDDVKAERLTNGQHFIQIKYIYEKYSCPVNILSTTQEILGVHLDRRFSMSQFAVNNTKKILELIKTLVETKNDSNDDADSFWEAEPDSTCLKQRCLLGDEKSSLSIKV